MLKYLAPLVFMALPATAQEMLNASRHPCETFEDAAKILFDSGQQILFTGSGVGRHLTGEEILAEVIFHVNQETGNWSLVSLHPSGMACLIMNGNNFEPFSQKN